MRNAIVSLLITAAVVSFFSFSNAQKGRPITDDYDEDEDEGVEVIDSPASHKGNATAIFNDSFGSPTRADTPAHRRKGGKK